nr:class III lanthipeptide [Vibrio cholerae]
MNKVLSLQKEVISKDVQLKAKSLASIQCKGSSN